MHIAFTKLYDFNWTKKGDHWKMCQAMYISANLWIAWYEYLLIVLQAKNEREEDAASKKFTTW